MRKPVFGVYDQVRHKLGCAVTDNSCRLEILEEEVLHYPRSKNKGADQLRGNSEADLCLCFRIYKKLVFL